MRYKKIMLILITAIFLVSIASVCAADANDTLVASEDTSTIEVDQSDEITENDGSQAIGQSDEEEPILEGIDADDRPILGEEPSTGSFTDLNYLINTQYASNDTITLSSNYKFSDGDGAFVHGITINRGVTIDGNGCTIDGSKNARIFNIDNGGTVKFLNINFINGKATGNGWEIHGGAIVAEYRNCVVESCNFTNNTADNQGGALMRVTAYKCTFTENQAQESGAIHQGSAYNCTFTKNQAGNNGGAIHQGSAYNCTFTENQAGEIGGAIYVGSAYNCTFTENQAGEIGGAIFYGSAYNCTFTENQAGRNGGAIYGSEHFPEDFTATLCIFDSNTPNDYAYIAIVDVALSADNLTTSYNSGDKLLFNLTADNTNYDGFNTTIKIYQNEQLVGTYYALSGDGWVVDLNPGTYKAVLSLDKYAGVSDETVTITVTGGTNPQKTDTNTSQTTNTQTTTTKKTDNVKLTLKKVKIKKSAKKLVLKATLKINGKKVKGKVIKFKFNGKTYKAKTNKKGVAKVTIKKKVLKKLKVGKKVKYQARYGKVTVKKTVKVKK